MQATDIEALIRAGVDCTHVVIEGDGVHWRALIVSRDFEDKARIARHKLVKATIQSQLASNEIHALSLKTLTPGEWKDTEVQ